MRSSEHGGVLAKCLLVVALVVFGTIASESLPNPEKAYSLAVLGTYAVSIAIDRWSLAFAFAFFLLAVIGALLIMTNVFIPTAMYPVVLSSLFCVLDFNGHLKSFKNTP